MNRVVKWMILSPLLLAWVLLLLLVVLWSASRLMTPTAADRAALALLQAPVPTDGSNAFAWLWLLDYDIPTADLDGVAAQDAQRLRDALTADPAELSPALPQDSSAHGHYPQVTVDAEAVAWCGLREGDCLAHVRAHREALAARLAQEASLLQRVRSLAGYGYVRSEFPPSLDTPLPPLRQLAISPTRSALDFVAGNPSAAFRASCTDVSTWRRLASNSDNLVVSMVGMALLDANARLLAQMLAERPLAEPLPAACRAAFDPALPPLDLCMAMQGEAASMFALLDRLDAAPRRLTEGAWYGLTTDVMRTKARMARSYVPACQTRTRELLARDAPLPPVREFEPVDIFGLDCIGNAAGCVLAGMSAPNQSKYLLRLQDTQARLRLTGLLLDLSAQAAGPAPAPTALAAAIAAQPPHLRAIAFDVAGGQLQIGLRDTSKGALWSVPLPATHLAHPAAAAPAAAVVAD